MANVTSNCGLCDARVINAYLCNSCEIDVHELIVSAGVTREDKGETILCLLDELDVQLSRRSRQSGHVPGHSANEPLPFDPKAAYCHSAIADVLTLWARHYGASATLIGPRVAARWLERNLALIVLSADVSVMYHQLKAVVMAGFTCIDRSQTSVYIGICSAPVIGGYCQFDLYALPDMPVVTCPRCTTAHTVESRRLVLLEAAEEQVMCATDLASVISRYGIPTTRDQIYKWKLRAMLDPIGINSMGDPIYRLGDVLTLARNSHLRRARLADKMR